MRQDLHNGLSYGRGVSPVVATDNTAIVSQIIDMQGYSALEFVICTGTLADADATFATLLEESDNSDMSSANAVADADMLGTEAAASFDKDDDDAVLSLGYKGIKRYVRLTVTPSGNSGSAPLAVLAVRRPEQRGTV